MLKKKRVDLEIIRIVAILFVMINHTATNGFVLEKMHQSSFQYIMLLCLASVARVAVPLFFMVSGALLLKKEESKKSFKVCSYYSCFFYNTVFLNDVLGTGTI